MIFYHFTGVNIKWIKRIIKSIHLNGPKSLRRPTRPSPFTWKKASPNGPLKGPTYGEEHSLSHSSSLGNPKATCLFLSPHASSSLMSLPLPTPLYKVHPLRLLGTFFRPFSPQNFQPLRNSSQSLPLTQRTHLFLPYHPVGLS